MTGWGINPGPIVPLSRRASGVLIRCREDRPRPYTRVTGNKGRRGISLTAAAKRYYASQDDLRAYLRSQMLSDDDVMEGRMPFKGHPYLFGLAIDVPLTKKGEIPCNAGDYDNYLKAWLDAITPKKKGGGMARLGLIEDDSLRWYRGPVEIRPVAVMASVDNLWRFHWEFRMLGGS